MISIVPAALRSSIAKSGALGFTAGALGALTASLEMDAMTPAQKFIKSYISDLDFSAGPLSPSLEFRSWPSDLVISRAPTIEVVDHTDMIAISRKVGDEIELIIPFQSGQGMGFRVHFFITGPYDFVGMAEPVNGKLTL